MRLLPDILISSKTKLKLLMTNVFYVYIHRDPNTKEIVYVGKGKNGRAWDITRSRSDNKEHQQWMIDQTIKGHLPCDWVEIPYRNLSEREALDKELKLLYDTGSTKFNFRTGEFSYQSKLSPQQVKEIYLLTREKEIFQKDIAKRYGVSRSAIAMISAGKQWKIVTAELRDAN